MLPQAGGTFGGDRQTRGCREEEHDEGGGKCETKCEEAAKSRGTRILDGEILVCVKRKRDDGKCGKAGVGMIQQETVNNQLIQPPASR